MEVTDRLRSVLSTNRIDVTQFADALFAVATLRGSAAVADPWDRRYR